MEALESLDSIWPRVKPCIKQLVPQMSQTDLFRTRAMLARILKASVQQLEPLTLDYADKYLAAGEADSKAAAILYQSGELALSVYHIQQAAEKAMKGFCLSVGAVTMEQLRKTHRTPQLILKTIEQWPGSEMSTILSGIDNKDYKRAIKKAKKLVNSDRVGQEQLAKLLLRSDKFELSIEVLLQLSDQLMAATPLLEQKEDEVKKVMAKCLPEYANSIMTYSLMKYGQAIGQCYIFGVLTFLHESYTRYPGGPLEPQDYTSKLGIVQAIPAIIERTPRMLNLVWDVISIARGQISGTNANESELPR